ncbi:hypothetical protein CDAR_442441 [Caerostris darwini]|uniref:Uncharacterized protein n=1 Tax=Caerostris darwini TaxID=1538125 RepID=A0AAV4V0V1_9ARAC|nr:hypothetical protein CDAR_442441 [Caerostris darwini]
MSSKKSAKRSLSEEIRNESSEDRQLRLVNVRGRTAEESMAEKQSRLEKEINRLSKLQAEQFQISEQRESKLQRKHELYQRVKATETPEERERRLEQKRVYMSRLRKAETPEQRERRLECKRAQYKRARETKTPEQRMARLEKRQKLYAQKNGKKNSKDVTPVEPPFVIKEEPIEFDPEPSTSADEASRMSERKMEM